MTLKMQIKVKEVKGTYSIRAEKFDSILKIFQNFNYPATYVYAKVTNAYT